MKKNPMKVMKKKKIKQNGILNYKLKKKENKENLVFYVFLIYKIFFILFLKRFNIHLIINKNLTSFFFNFINKA